MERPLNCAVRSFGNGEDGLMDIKGKRADCIDDIADHHDDDDDDPSKRDLKRLKYWKRSGRGQGSERRGPSAEKNLFRIENVGFVGHHPSSCASGQPSGNRSLQCTHLSKCCHAEICKDSSLYFHLRHRVLHGHRNKVVVKQLLVMRSVLLFANLCHVALVPAMQQSE